MPPVTKPSDEEKGVAPKEAAVSRERGVQHINDDVDAPFDPAEHAKPAQNNPEGEEEVYATGIGGLTATTQDLAAEIEKKVPRRSELVRLQGIIDQLIGRSGQTIAAPGVPLNEEVAMYPVDQKATDNQDHKAAAKLLEVEPEELLAFAVRRRQSSLGEPLGPSYLSYVRANGSVGVVELDKK